MHILHSQRIPSPVFGLVILCGKVGVQVSEEAPSFATDSKFGDLLVVVVPQQVGSKTAK